MADVDYTLDSYDRPGKARAPLPPVLCEQLSPVIHLSRRGDVYRWGCVVERDDPSFYRRQEMGEMVRQLLQIARLPLVAHPLGEFEARAVGA